MATETHTRLTYGGSNLATASEVSTAVDAHVNDTSDAHDASAISVLDSGANYTATDVEAALAEEADARQAHEANTSNPHSVTAAQAGAVPTTRTVSTTAPLTGGGDLSANRTLAVSAASDTASGVVELATSAETTTGTDTTRATTPAGVKAVSDTLTPTARTISTTAPLTGGGDLSANRTLAVSSASSIAQGVVELATDAETTTGTDTARATTPANVKAAIDVHLNDTTAAHAATAISYAGSTNLAATDVEGALDELDSEKTPATRTISTTAPLTGGGDLSANRTLAVSAASDTAAGVVELATSAETTTGTDITRATTPAGVKAVSDTLTPTARTISTTAPLTGGGDLSANRTLAVSSASSTAQGVVELATDAETTTGTDTARATTPANVKAAIDVHLNDTSAAHAASAISFSPTGTIAATDVQAAIAEVASEAGGGGGIAKYSANVGDGSTTNIAVTHSLGTKDITVTLRQVSDDVVYHVDWTATSTTVVTLNFSVAPTTNQFDVTVIG